MPNKDFLENYSLYRTFDTDWDFTNGPRALHEIPKPAIHMYCEICDSDQTFNMTNKYWEVEERGPNDNAAGKVVRALYSCSACGKGLRVFFIRFFYRIVKNKDGNQHHLISMRKVGQYPPWSIKTDKRLDKLLGKHRDYYKKGLINESQGYGVGAHAYFRRITEDIIDELLDSITDLIEPSEKEKYLAGLKKTKRTRVTEEKIDLVKDLLPASLRPDDMNPLKALHSALSEGLHSKSDEECLRQSEIIRQSLIFLVNQIERTKEEKKEFTEGIRKLLNKKK